MHTVDEPRWLTETELDAWRRLASLLLLLPGRLEEPLRDHELSFFEYSVLAGLSDGIDHTLPMTQLAAFSNSSRSRLSHTVKRLEDRGWVVRRTDPTNRRVTLATLTDAGYAKLVATAPTHVESVRQLVFDALTAEQVDQLADVCTTLVAHFGPDIPPPWFREADAPEAAPHPPE